MSTEKKKLKKRRHGYTEKVRSLSKVQKKMDNFVLKELKDNNQTTKQEQKTSLNPK